MKMFVKSNIVNLVAEKKRHKFNINDTCRIGTYIKQFRKSYVDENFTDEVFLIAGKLETNLPTYRINELKDSEIMDVAFYEQQMQQVTVWNSTLFLMVNFIFHPFLLPQVPWGLENLLLYKIYFCIRKSGRCGIWLYVYHD